MASTRRRYPNNDLLAESRHELRFAWRDFLALKKALGEAG